MKAIFPTVSHHEVQAQNEPYEPIDTIRLISGQDTCAILNISPSELKKVREKGLIPFINVRSRYYYFEIRVHELVAVSRLKRKRTKINTSKQAANDIA